MDKQKFKRNYTREDIPELFFQLKRKGWSLIKISELTGIRPSTLSTWSTGKRQVNNVTLLAISMLDDELNNSMMFEKLKKEGRAFKE